MNHGLNSQAVNADSAEYSTPSSVHYTRGPQPVLFGLVGLAHMLD